MAYETRSDLKKKLNLWPQTYEVVWGNDKRKEILEECLIPWILPDSAQFPELSREAFFFTHILEVNLVQTTGHL